MIPEQQKGESKKAYTAFGDYCQMGAGRSLSLLVNQYQTNTKPIPPTKNITSLKVWSSRYEWQARVTQYDRAVQMEAEAKAAAYRASILEQGYAVQHERVKALNELAELLLWELRKEDKRWVKDVKGIGKDDRYERVEIVRFNAPLIDQFRGALDDLAKETEGRKLQHEVGGKPNNPIHVDLTVAQGVAAEELVLWRKALQEKLSSGSNVQPTPPTSSMNIAS